MCKVIGDICREYVCVVCLEVCVECGWWCPCIIGINFVVVVAESEVSLSLTSLLSDAGAVGASQREEESLLFVSEVSDITAAGSAQSEEDSLLLMIELLGMSSTDSAQSEEESLSSVNVLSNTAALASAHVGSRGHICCRFGRVSCEKESLLLMSELVDT